MIGLRRLLHPHLQLISLVLIHLILTPCLSQTSPPCTYDASGSMEGAIYIKNGDYVSAGYDFTVSTQPTTTALIEFTQAKLSITGTCSNGGSDTLVINFPTGPTPSTAFYTVPVGSSGWIPTDNEQSAQVFQGGVVANVCGGVGTLNGSKGAVFHAVVTSTTAITIHIRWHYRDPNAKGKGNWDCTTALLSWPSDRCGASWSGTGSICPCVPSGQVIGDPVFHGLRGQVYQVHGVCGEVYNIISDNDFQLNSKFVFLSSGSCPTAVRLASGEYKDKKSHGCWSHPGSYLGTIGIQDRYGHQIKLVSGSFTDGFQEVSVNGEKMAIGDELLFTEGDEEHGRLIGSVETGDDAEEELVHALDGINHSHDAPPSQSPSSFISFNTSHTVEVSVGHFHFIFENSDFFINQHIEIHDWSVLSAHATHGLLGQSWSRKTYKNSIKHIEGHVDDYSVKGKDLFGNQFLFNRFNRIKDLEEN